MRRVLRHDKNNHVAKQRTDHSSDGASNMPAGVPTYTTKSFETRHMAPTVHQTKISDLLQSLPPEPGICLCGRGMSERVAMKVGLANAMESDVINGGI
jgi:hypothetical protein